MSKLIITSNKHVRDLVAFDQLPESVREDFDYMTTRYPEEISTPRFVNYRGSWFDTEDTEGLAPDAMRAHGWDHYITTSFFDGYVFGYFDRDGNPYEDGVRIGHFYYSDEPEPFAAGLDCDGMAGHHSDDRVEVFRGAGRLLVCGRHAQEL